MIIRLRGDSVAPSLLATGLYSPPPINFLHDPFCPPDGIGNGAHRGGHACSAIVLGEFPSREDAGGDQQHALATFVHARSLALSPYIRHCIAVA